MARILVADDEAGLREFVTDVLEMAEHTVAAAADGEEAAGLLGRESFDLLITDLRMPKLDGMALLRRVRAEQPELEVVVLTAHGSVDSAVEAMKLGAFDYLQKPISSPDELRLIVARALERKTLRGFRDRAAREVSSLPPLSHGDPVMEPVVEALRKVAPTNTSVLFTGESGTGKEVAARTLHAWSKRADGPFVAVNCAAIAESLLESELFGHEKGAFTGATAQRRGRIELADGGTFFLDEVSEMKPELQAKLLRVIQERSFERVGGTRSILADVRWIAATNRDIHALLDSGEFRTDLYHRLAVFPIHMPPLRTRRQDILPLAATLLGRIGAELGRPDLELAEDARGFILGTTWPGNVRELANALERAAILAGGDLIAAEHLVSVPAPDAPAGRALTLEEIERAAIERALAEVGGNRREAAERLGIGLRTLYEKLKRYRDEQPA